MTAQPVGPGPRENDKVAKRQWERDSVRHSSMTNNEEVASTLCQVADLLEGHGANPFRARAYRTAADTIRKLDQPVAQIMEQQGLEGLMSLPGIGNSLAHSIEQLIHSGRLPLLQRLRGDNRAEHLFQTVSDIGPKMAQRIHEQLGIETLAELYSAALDGRLARIPGVGTKRLRAVRESLAGRFQQAKGTQPRRAVTPSTLPADVTIDELLDVDREYRELAKKGRLPRIAPRRFNPTREAWLPVLHAQRGPRHYTALYSNTLRAHEMGTTHDWVVIYRDDPVGDGRWTVITAMYGPLAGRRVARGLETACAEYYGLPSPQAADEKLVDHADQLDNSPID